MVYFILKVLSWLPLRALHVLGAGSGWLLFRLPTKARRRAVDNIANCFPELSAAEQRQWVQAVLVETAKSFFETAAIWNWPGGRVLSLVTEVSGRHLVDQAAQRDKGAIIVMPHLGSWELTTIYCSSLAPMTTLYKPPRSARLESMMLAGRQGLGARFVPTDANGVRALLKGLSRRELVGILPDQYPKPGSGVHVPFFGQSAYTMTLVGRLVQKTGATVVFAFAERLPRGSGFHMHFVENPTDLTELGLEAITAAINAGIETCVKTIPTQYQWTYKRFRPDVDAYMAKQAASGRSI